MDLPLWDGAVVGVVKMILLAKYHSCSIALIANCGWSTAPGIWKMYQIQLNFHSTKPVQEFVASHPIFCHKCTCIRPGAPPCPNLVSM